MTLGPGIPAPHASDPVAAPAPTAVRATPATGVPWRDFPAFVWRLDHPGEALPDELARGFGGTNVEGTAAEPWAKASSLELYLGSAAGWSELHLERSFGWYDALWNRWYDERDAALLVREPCLSAPATRERLERNLDASLAAFTGADGRTPRLRFALIGDEVGLTPWGDPLDLCVSPTCAAAWRAWAGARRGELGLEDGDALPELVEVDTDRVRRALAEGDAQELGAWLARRRFHMDVVLDLLRGLAEHAGARAPGTPVGLGGLVGRTAFGGVAFERLLDRYDVLEPYAVGDARELAATLRGDHALLATVFVDASAEAADDDAAHAVWEHWLRGGDGVVVWSDRELAARPDVALRLREALAAVRGLREEIPDWRPRPEGIALVNDGDATALAWLFDALVDGTTWPRRFAGYQAEHGTRERAVDAWLRLAEDAGFLPGSLPLEALDAEMRRRFPALVLCSLRALSDGDVERLAAHVAAGGTLFVDGPLGTYDRGGRRRTDDVREHLASLAPGRVLDAPTELATYLADRAAAQRRADALRGRLRELLAGAGVRPVVARFAESGPPPPALAVERTLARGRVLAWLPQRDGVPAAAEPLALELSGARAVRWLWPQAGERGERRLAPGDAAVVIVE